MASHHGIHLTPAFQQFRRRVRWALAAVDAPLRHVGKLEAQHVEPCAARRAAMSFIQPLSMGAPAPWARISVAEAVPEAAFHNHP
jgi:hypothetical protein